MNLTLHVWRQKGAAAEGLTLPPVLSSLLVCALTEATASLNASWLVETFGSFVPAK